MGQRRRNELKERATGVPARRSPWASTLLAVAGLVVIGFGGILWLRGNRPGERETRRPEVATSATEEATANGARPGAAESAGQDQAREGERLARSWSGGGRGSGGAVSQARGPVAAFRWPVRDRRPRGGRGRSHESGLLQSRADSRLGGEGVSQGQLARGLRRTARRQLSGMHLSPGVQPSGRPAGRHLFPGGVQGRNSPWSSSACPIECQASRLAALPASTASMV